MPDSERHESQDLENYDVRDGSDSLDGNPGDDPLDRGVAAPERWSAGMREAWAGEEESESLDELLDKEEPEETPGDAGWDENATTGDAGRLRRDAEPDPRAGRLTTADEDTGDVTDTLTDTEPELFARDTGIDGGAASAEEAAVHVEEDPAGS